MIDSEAARIEAEVKARTDKLLREATDQLNSIKAEIENDKTLLASIRKKLDATKIEFRNLVDIIKNLYESVNR